jgi:hypothetical protein
MRLRGTRAVASTATVACRVSALYSGSCIQQANIGLTLPTTTTCHKTTRV